MPAFDTPAPISVTVELGIGDIQITATDRTDTVVEVRPSDAARRSDVTAAEQALVEFAAGRLLIKAPKGWRQWTLRGGGDSIDVQIALPTGSHVRVQAGMATLRCTGRLGECRSQTGVGDVQLGQAGPVQLKTGAGDIAVDRALDHAEVATGSGGVRIRSIGGSATIKNSNGDTWIGEVTGDLRVNAANGRISVDQAGGAVAAKTANGDIRIGQVARGEILAQTARGSLEVGVPEGVAAWLDLDTKFGSVLNSLEDSERPEPGEDTVQVRARSAHGDISIHRCAADPQLSTSLTRPAR